jgi:hypothetical protein
VIFVNNISLFDNMTALDLRETGMNGECAALEPAAGPFACRALLSCATHEERPLSAGAFACLWGQQASLMWSTPRVLTCCVVHADVGLSACTSLLELRVLKIRPSIPFGVITAPIIDLAEVSQLTQLTSLSMPLPKLRTTVLQSIGRLTGLRVSCVF